MNLILKNRSFATLLSGQAVSRFGDFMYGLALQWTVLSISKGAMELAIVALCSMIPQLLLGSLVGPFVDRWNKRSILIGSDLCRAIILLAIFVLFEMHLGSIWFLYTATVLLSIASLFFYPAYSALYPRIVAKDDLPRANAINSSVNSTVTILGLGVGGAFIGIFGENTCILIDSITFFISVVSLFLIRTHEAEPTKTGVAKKEKNQYWRELGEGFKYVRSNHLILFVCLFAVILNVGASPLDVLQPLLAKDVLHQGSTVLGMFGIASTLGGLFMGLLLSKFKKVAGKGILFLIAGTAQGLSLVMLGLSEYVVLSLIALFVAGMTFAAINVPFFTILQARVDSQLIGRVVAIVVTLSNSVTPFAKAACGWAAPVVGVANVYVIGGTLSLTVGIVLFIIPKIRMMVNEPKASTVSVS